ncbi:MULTISPECIES: Sec-independent protein translocase subunit TatA [unclassified Streptomyces]|uniref:Sec-independent protein translocase subunit TatA n=1 Tax=unclassified Streptomyces TaxID=2593676 RepID=UPI0022864D43|nr:Sec-independent protein translocase subunit TatA [Streptomyces sp. Je 1-369]WAL97853.1 Sec-independent protein translocase subunit TatA [Streptomyces sp. Je 1-369]
MIRNALEPWHLLIVVLVVVVLFGSKKLPDAARSVGKSLRILKSETKALRDEDAQRDQQENRQREKQGPADVTS